MTHQRPTTLSDRDLLDATTRAAARERSVTTELLSLLAELDSRKLYIGEGFSSLFTYCTLVLRLSESAAYSRITAARIARRYPIVLRLMAEGEVNLTTLSLLAGHLTDENHEAVLDAARRKSKREVERLIACLDPQPDVPASLRKLPSRTAVSGPPASAAGLSATAEIRTAPLLAIDRAEAISVAPSRLAARALVTPVAPERYLLKMTVSRETHAKLERARDLLRHVIPGGDPAAIVDRALTLLVEQLERAKCARTSHPRARARTRASSGGRHIPASVRRTVWARDAGRCAFVGTKGRCAETGCLEFHHVVPFAVGGTATVENIELRCRSHNAHESVRFFTQTEADRTRRLASADSGH